MINSEQILEEIKKLKKEQTENCSWEIRKDIEREIDNLIDTKCSRNN